MTSLQIPITTPTLTYFSASPNFKGSKKIEFLLPKWNGFAMNSCKERSSFGDMGFREDGILMGRGRRKSRFVVVRANPGFGFNGGGWDEERRKKVLGNLALAIGLTYVTMTDQLGWILDAIVSIWLLGVLIPIVGLGVLFWYAGRDLIQSSVLIGRWCATLPILHTTFFCGGQQICKRTNYVLFWALSDVRTSIQWLFTMLQQREDIL